MADIFLSYGEADRETAGRIARLLEGQGWSVWWDRKIPGGQTWREVIQSALQDMRCMVVLWSRSSVDSFWVNEEAEEGRTRKQLMPVLIERVVPPIGFRSVQTIDLVDWDGSPEASGVQRLIGDVAALLTHREANAPATSAAGVDGQSDAAVRERARAVFDRRREAQGASDKITPNKRKNAIWLLAASIAVLAVFVGVRALDVSGNKKNKETLESKSDHSIRGATGLSTDSGGTTIVTQEKLLEEPAYPDDVNAKKQAKSMRCGDILQKQSLGEPLTAAERVYLKKEC
jgi:TIR domain